MKVLSETNTLQSTDNTDNRTASRGQYSSIMAYNQVQGLMTRGSNRNSENTTQISQNQ